ncbi:MAG TPA: hypothetical protein VFH88_02625, partial [Candidatus Krumholzibacteria bacterium]|nr:hypothetical protein [Candidatus Krumholzibacteria bacterium]
VVIYGTRATDTSEGVLAACDLATGNQVWTHVLPASLLEGWYGRELIDSGRMQPDASDASRCGEILFTDVDADGADDMIVRWQLIPWYPTLVTWYPGGSWPSRGDEALHVYRTSGRVNFVRAVNLDSDAKMEVVLAGCNNAPVYEGAMITILDDTHWSGASFDSLSSRDQWGGSVHHEDGSLARVVFPAFSTSVMSALGVRRLDVPSLVTMPHDRTHAARLVVGIGDERDAMVIVTLDANLNLINFLVPESARDRLRLVSPRVAETFNDGYVRRWLKQRRVFRSAR